MANTRDLRLNSVPGYNAHLGTSGVLISASSTEEIVITDIMASTTGILKEDSSGGDAIVTIASAGHSNLVSPIKVSKGASVYNDNPSMSITVCYWKNRVS